MRYRRQITYQIQRNRYSPSVLSISSPPALLSALLLLLLHDAHISSWYAFQHANVVLKQLLYLVRDVALHDNLVQPLCILRDRRPGSEFLRELLSGFLQVDICDRSVSAWRRVSVEQSEIKLTEDAQGSCDRHIERRPARDDQR